MTKNEENVTPSISRTMMCPLAQDMPWWDTETLKDYDWIQKSVGRYKQNCGVKWSGIGMMGNEVSYSFFHTSQLLEGKTFVTLRNIIESSKVFVHSTNIC